MIQVFFDIDVLLDILEPTHILEMRGKYYADYKI